MKKFLDKKQQYLAVVLSVVLSVLVVWVAVSGATTISTNINTGGTLDVTGASTLTGNVTMGGTLAVTSSSTVAGAFNASGASTLAGAATLRSTLAVTDTSTLTGLATMAGGFVSQASSTVSAGHLNVRTLGIATSSATQELSVTGDIYLTGSLGVGTSSPAVASEIAVDSSATTTLYISSRDDTAGSTSGGCIQMEASNGAIYRMYIGVGTDNTALATTTAGRGAAGNTFLAVWELGPCE